MSSVRRDITGRFLYVYSGGECYVCDLLSKPLGAGAIGVVYLATEFSTKRPIALKIIRQNLSSSYQVRNRTWVEANMSFMHPNVVRMLGVCQEERPDGVLCLLSEYISGETFDVYSSKLNSLDPLYKIINILKCSIPILDALEYIHKIGVIHRDIKPSNIMITYDGVPKLMDFGISGFGREINTPSGFMGTALYAPPEVINGLLDDTRSDIYSMGVTLYELLTGSNPFSAETQEKIFENQFYYDLPRTNIIPRQLLKVLRKSTEKDIDKRYSSARELSDDISRFISRYV